MFTSNWTKLNSVPIIAYNSNVHFARNVPFSQTRSHILTPKEMATTVATRAGAAMVELHDPMPFHFSEWEYDHSGTGIDAKGL